MVDNTKQLFLIDILRRNITMSTINLSKFKKIIDNLRKLGFNNFYQAGSPSQYHELNLIVNNEKQNRKYWIEKSFGKFGITYRESIDDIKAKSHHVKCSS